jgi:flagellin
MASMVSGISIGTGSLEYIRRADRAVSAEMERLSSGLRVNRAGDDAASLAISGKMAADVRSASQALRNISDGASLLQTAESGLESIQDAMQRARVLAVQSANTTYSSTDRTNLNTEFQALLTEIDRIASSTSFNGIQLLDGNLAERDGLKASVAQTSALSASEILTFDGALFQDLGSSDREVSLGSGLTQSQVVDTINGSTVGTVVTASVDNGFLKLTAKTTDSVASFTVASTKAASSSSTGFGTSTLVQLYGAEGTTVRVSAGTTQTGNLGANETLTFAGALFEGLTSSEQQVTISSGSSQATVISTINSSIIGNFLTASSDASGNLRFTAKTIEGASTFQVSSNKAATATSTGVGTTAIVALGTSSSGSTTASVTSGQALPTLSKDEDLTFTGALFGTITVTLSKSVAAATTVTNFNNSTAGKYITASLSGGALKLTANVAGAAGSFTVESNKTGAGQTGFAASPTAALGQDGGDTTKVASITAGVAQTAVINNTETLTFSGILFRDLATADRQVSLAKGDSLATNITTINNSIAGQFVTASNDGGFLKITAKVASAEGTFFVTSNKAAGSDQSGVGVSLVGGLGPSVSQLGPIDIQVDTGTKSSDKITIAIDSATAASLGVAGSDITTAGGATDSLTRIDAALKLLSEQRAKLGASMNRLAMAADYLTQNRQAMIAANSRLMDSDVAMATASRTANLVRLNSGIAIQAQTSNIERTMLSLVGQMGFASFLGR